MARGRSPAYDRHPRPHRSTRRRAPPPRARRRRRADRGSAARRRAATPRRRSRLRRRRQPWTASAQAASPPSCVVGGGRHLITLAQLHPDLHLQEQHARRAATWAPTCGRPPTCATTSSRTSGSPAGRPTGTPASRCTTSTWCCRRWLWCCSTCVLPYGVAFKIVTVAGIVTLPLCCWAFGRLARLRFPIPELFAVAGVFFLFDESFTIYGGNIASHDGGRVLVLHRPVARRCSASACSPRAARPASTGRRPRVLALGAALPRHRGHLRRHRHVVLMALLWLDRDPLSVHWYDAGARWRC